MKAATVSRYTWVVFSVATLAVIVTALLVTFRVGGDAGVVAASDIGEALVVGLAAVAILRSAFRLGPNSSVGRPWLFIGLGTLSYFVGDLIWTVLEVGMGREVPYPGLPDLLYLVEYPLFAIGILSAGLAYRGLVPLKRPGLIAAGLGAALSALVYFGLLAPYVLFDADVALGEKILSAAYPLGDVVLMVGPALFVLGVAFTLGGGKLAWPWYAVALGTVVIAATDTAYSWLSTYDLYASGSVIDYGWSMGHALVMLGALVARDLATRRG